MHLPDALVARLDVPVPRYTSYPTVPAWSSSFGADEYKKALAGADPALPLSLYVHVPFCRVMCSYCGCNVVVTKDAKRGDRYIDQIAAEAKLVAEALGPRRTLARVHWGGGTPTFLDERQIERLWQVTTSHFDIAKGAEVAIEVNPVGTRRTQLEVLARLGFDRLSIGVQDLEPTVQAAIGRTQSFEETRQTIETARQAGFRCINVDLIYGLPRQTRASVAKTMEQVIALSPDRLAVFSFAFVPQLKPHQRRLPAAELPSGSEKLALFEVAAEALVLAGYREIGFDHFAKPTDELVRALDAGTLKRDFQGYTTVRAPMTIGLGPSAISGLGTAYAQNAHVLSKWEEGIAAGRLPIEKGIWLEGEDGERGALIQELMCQLRVDLPDAQRFAPELAAYDAFAADGLCTRSGSHIEVTPLGRRFLRNLAQVLDGHRESVGRAQSRAV